jgi:S-adenosylmethionine-dependent methyltransferase
MLDTSRFQDADRYASYLKTRLGRLRSELAWENLRPFLPPDASTGRALDLGGGTGWASLQLARMGFEVVLLDSCEEMLAVARQQAEASSTTGGISFCHADAGRLPELFEAGYFNVVVCHNLLEYLENPSIVVRHVARVLREDAVVSLLVRNRAGEVLRAAIDSADCKLAKANLSADTVTDTLFGEPVRIFAPEYVRCVLSEAGMKVIAERGVRVFSDYLDLPDDLSDQAYGQLFDLEKTLGARPQFAAVARYFQVIANRSNTPSGTETTQ